MEVKTLISKIDSKTKDEILRKTQYSNLRTEDNIIEIAQLLLPFIDDEVFCSTFDYLHCKAEHRNHLQKIKEQASKQKETMDHFEDLFYELRREFSTVRSMIIDYIRYGKRSAQIDELLTKFVMLDKLIASSSQKIDIYGDASSRCSHCNKDCLASYRIMFGIVSAILSELRL